MSGKLSLMFSTFFKGSSRYRKMSTSLVFASSLLILTCFYFIIQTLVISLTFYCQMILLQIVINVSSEWKAWSSCMVSSCPVIITCVRYKCACSINLLLSTSFSSASVCDYIIHNSTSSAFLMLLRASPRIHITFIAISIRFSSIFPPLL